MKLKKELVGIMVDGMVRIETSDGTNDYNISQESVNQVLIEGQKVKGKLVTRRGIKLFLIKENKILKLIEEFISEQRLTIPCDIEKLPDMGRGYQVGKMEVLNLLIDKLEMSIDKVVNRKQEPE